METQAKTTHIPIIIQQRTLPKLFNLKCTLRLLRANKSTGPIIEYLRKMGWIESIHPLPRSKPEYINVVLFDEQQLSNSKDLVSLLEGLTNEDIMQIMLILTNNCNSHEEEAATLLEYVETTFPNTSQ